MGAERKTKAKRRAEPRSRAPVEITWRTRTRPLADRAVRAALRAALEYGGRAGLALSVVFVGDRELARMHARWLGDPSPTDVIAFDLGEDGGGPAAELYVSAERAVQVARERAGDARRELALYLVHGALHLCGHGDARPSDRVRMRGAEARVLARLGYAPDRHPFDA